MSGKRPTIDGSSAVVMFGTKHHHDKSHSLLHSDHFIVEVVGPEPGMTHLFAMSLQMEREEAARVALAAVRSWLDNLGIFGYGEMIHRFNSEDSVNSSRFLRVETWWEKPIYGRKRDDG